MTTYVKALMGEFAGETEKAFALTNGHGAWGRQNASHEWFPKSRCIIGEANEYGWREVLIPAWLLNQKSIKDIEVFDEVHHYIDTVKQ